MSIILLTTTTSSNANTENTLSEIKAHTIEILKTAQEYKQAIQNLPAIPVWAIKTENTNTICLQALKELYPKIQFWNASPAASAFEPTTPTPTPTSTSTSVPVPTSTPAFNIPSPVAQTNLTPTQKNTANPSEFARSNSNITDKQLAWDAFRFSTYEQKEASTQRRIEQILEEASLRYRVSPLLRKEVEKNIRQGEKALAEWLKIKPLIRKNNTEAAIAEIVNSHESKKIRDFLENKIKKEKEYINKQIAKRAQSMATNAGVGTISCQTIPINLKNKKHPNSLKDLPPSISWNVYIDETGNKFTVDDELKKGDTLGRIVAVAIPQESQKQMQGDTNFHATDSSNENIDHLLNQILSNKLGILGLEIQEPTLNTAANWFSSVNELIKWVLKIIPIFPNQSSVVKFFIESRAEFTSKLDLSALEEVIRTELNSIDALHFGKLKFNLSFAQQANTPQLAYADVIAHTWGSPSNLAKQRRHNSALVGPCLIPAKQLNNINRLYTSLSAHQNLKPHHWFEIVQAIDSENETSILLSQINQLSEKIKNQPEIWTSYLAYIQSQIQNKTYQAVQLQKALKWLKNNQPVNCQIDSLTQLHWVSYQLAGSNHTGQINAQLFVKADQLAADLMDEYAREVSEIKMKMAVTATNAFEFKTAYDILKPLAELDVRIIGLKNKAKVLSSIGQYYAFTHQIEKATPYFDQAIELFKKSTAANKNTDIQQTQLYKLIALSSEPQQISFIISELENQYGPLEALAEQLSKNFDPQMRFVHVFLLRLMNQYPSQLEKLTQSYLKNINNWVCDEGHPWQLIEFYRGILLLASNTHLKADSTMIYCFKNAVSLCQLNEQGHTLHYMSNVFQWLTMSLAIKAFEIKDMSLSTIEANLTHAPINTLKQAPKPINHEEFWRLMNQLLPFNFH